jgi:hypothetical protein
MGFTVTPVRVVSVQKGVARIGSHADVHAWGELYMVWIYQTVLKVSREMMRKRCNLASLSSMC